MIKKRKSFVFIKTLKELKPLKNPPGPNLAVKIKQSNNPLNWPKNLLVVFIAILGALSILSYFCLYLIIYGSCLVAHS